MDEYEQFEAYASFLSLVKRMRESQKMYFKTRDRAVLDESKRLEKEVDRRIGEAMYGQPKLFEVQ